MTVYYKMRQILQILYFIRQLFYSKMRQKFITKCDSYYKLRQFYYKMQHLLQNVTFVTNRDNTVLIVFYKTAFLHTVSYLN